MPRTSKNIYKRKDGRWEARLSTEKGVDVKTLSEILGHANVGITLNTYVHSSMALKRTQLEKLS